MRVINLFKNIICTGLIIALVFGSSTGVVYAGKPSVIFSLDGPINNGDVMEYNARPQVISASWLGTARNQIAVEFSEEMAVVGKYSVLNVNNYEFSNDGGKTWIALGKQQIQSIEGLDQNTKVIISLKSILPPTGGKLEEIRVAEVADKDDKRTATAENVVLMKARDIDRSRVIKPTAVNPNQITIETDFRILKLNPWAFSIGIGEEIGTPLKAEYKNSESGSRITLFLNGQKTIDPDGKNLSFLTINTGGISDYFGITNKEPIKYTGTELIDGIEPSITEAITKDIDSDGRIDQIRITYNERVKLNKSTGMEVNVDGYEVKRTSVKDCILTVDLFERKDYDTGAEPFIQMYGEISDMAGNIPVEDTEGVRVSDKVPPTLVSASILVNGKRDGFGNDRGDAMVLRFSEPVFTKFKDGRYPNSIELFNLFKYIQDGEEKDIFLSGKYEAKDLGSYPANELTIIVGSQTMGGAIKKGDLLKINSIGMIKDKAGLDVSIKQGLIRIK